MTTALSPDATFIQHTADSAPEGARETLAALQQGLGFVPNLFATMAESPPAVNGYLALDGVLARGAFTPSQRQLLATVVSSENGCAYCTAAHSTFAGSLRAAPDAVAAARADAATAADPKTAALLAFTRALMRARGHADPSALATFLAAGFTKAQAMEVAAHIGLKTISNYIDGFAHVPLDGAFAPQRWEPAAD